MNGPQRVAGTGHFATYDPPKWNKKPNVWTTPKIPLVVWLTGGVIVFLLIKRP